MKPKLSFDRGTLIFEASEDFPVPPTFITDDRISQKRALAREYRATVEWLIVNKHPYDDQAKTWQELKLKHLTPRQARTYQTEAVQYWEKAGRKGVIVLPTGTGKSYVAELCMLSAKRPTLIVVPTLDLVSQWAKRLKTTFGIPIGILGGGTHTIEQITVSTYASAYIHAERYGDKFGFVIFDEVHHLPSESYRLISDCLLAPFRLGLSATPERADEAHLQLEELVGPIVYQKDIRELAGQYLANYETVRLYVHLSEEEQEAYNNARSTYTSFIGGHKIPMSGKDGWQKFIQIASRSKEGRKAHKAWLEARRIAHGTERKLDLLEQILLFDEVGRRTLIFTDDNATAYRISRELLVPIITHHTPAKERVEILEGFSSGIYPCIVTSRVLNEGVDIPAVEVGVVVSGTGSVREHVQRLGRILRPSPGKQAVLYEMIAAGTSEERTSDRRRAHEAYE